ncbi:TetR family transcriptional regulator C-terminal domain-containing protein [Rhizobium jaguaris]|uniref:TetR/AcrR family transcriptional regulator n=1 Tax=Rhizobium jaguaris TaxID=1312183 RepID=UPI0039BF6F7A
MTGWSELVKRSEMKSSTGAKRGPKPKPDTRNNLLQVGLQIIHAEGYAATGIQSIVDGADVPKASFYNHFPSKEAFGIEVIDAYFDRNESKLRDFFCNSNVGPLARLEAYFDDRIAAFRANGFARGCLLGNFAAEVADHSEPVREHVVEHLEAWSSFFEKCIAEAQERRDIDNKLPAALLGRFVLNSWEGALLRMRAEKSDAALLEFKEVIFGGLFA